MKGQNLRQLCESMGHAGAYQRLDECLQQRLVKPEDFSLRELAEAFCGYNWVARLNPKNLSRFSQADVMEAGEGVDVSAFAHITGQLFFNKIMQGWENAALIGEKLVETIPTKLDGEIMPWIGHVRQEGEEVHPGEPYPEASFGERYINTPRTQKQGMILSVTKEAVFFDLTGQFLRAAGEVGYRLGYNKEKLILRTVSGIDNSYQLNGSSANTYLTSAGASPNNYVNALASTPLIDWTSINQFYIQAAKITDPDTGNPIQSEPKQLLVMPDNLFTARRIVGASEVRSTYPGYSASSPAAPGNVQMVSSNPVPNLEVMTSSILRQLVVANLAGGNDANGSAYWFIGDFKRSFAWMENWPLQAVQAPANNEKDFEQDIVARYKASYRGVPAVLDPRYVQKFYNS